MAKLNKVVLITGGAKRIGRIIALNLAKKGYDIAIHYNTSTKEALKLQKEIADLGIKSAIFCYDLNQNCYSDLIDAVIKEFSKIDILINNASIFEPTSFLQTNLDLFDRHFNINLKAPFFLTQHFAKKQKSGLIINFLDSRITKTSKNYFSYLLTKKSLDDFTKMAAKELGPDIRVNSIAPGITEFSEDIDNQIYLTQLLDSLPLKEIINKSQINKAVEIILENEFMTGQNIFIDAGGSL